MIISDSKKFIFIHIYKTGGTSIRSVLSHYHNGIPLSGTKCKVSESENFWMHMGASELRKQIDSKNFDEYFKFSFVRNPWDWKLSEYYYIMYGYRQITGKVHPTYEHFKNFSFKEFLYGSQRTQKSFIADEENNLMVDFVGKFEKLQEDFNKICEKIGIEKKNLPHLQSTTHPHYTKCYNKETKKIVSDIWAEDIETFDYRFGD